MRCRVYWSCTTWTGALRMPSFPGLQDYFEKDDVLFDANPWAILSTDKLAGYMMQVAVIGHKCDQFDVVQFLDEEDCILGVCWWCKTPIPENVQGMWKMLNWDTLPRMKQYDPDYWIEKDTYPTTRPNHTMSPTTHNKKTQSVARNPKTYKYHIHKPEKDKTKTWGPCGPDFDSTGKRLRYSKTYVKKQTIIGRYTAP